MSAREDPRSVGAKTRQEWHRQGSPVCAVNGAAPAVQAAPTETGGSQQPAPQGAHVPDEAFGVRHLVHDAYAVAAGEQHHAP
eukprot:870019-Prymnesium_polylepis.1